ncbi:MAG: Unknown protein [uncultured Campylobacterales bacterium]|uniref:Uncharacterized protein n=1 Tax=uncultured Campylobacterales bacterium TaxID=352960 RepID=A0A6S6TCK2_9BACT|nr:MAG: Unknown protein [uncultured Campylobacterales bacterium]
MAFFNYQCNRDDFDSNDNCDDCYKPYFDDAKARNGGTFNPGTPDIYCTSPSRVCSIGMTNPYTCTYPQKNNPDNNTRI